jgi:hypothetical protein
MFILYISVCGDIQGHLDIWSENHIEEAKEKAAKLIEAFDGVCIGASAVITDHQGNHIWELETTTEERAYTG